MPKAKIIKPVENNSITDSDVKPVKMLDGYRIFRMIKKQPNIKLKNVMTKPKLNRIFKGKPEKVVMASITSFILFFSVYVDCPFLKSFVTGMPTCIKPAQ